MPDYREAMTSKPKPRPRFTRTRVIGRPFAPMSHLYAMLLDARWRWVALAAATLYVAVNVLFALLYLAGGDCIAGAEPGSFADAFYFSVQTISTIGYGAMAPKTTYAHIVVTAEAFVGLMGFAIGAGLVFAKFARPTAGLLFSSVAVIDRFDGKPQLMFRVANWRRNTVVEARATVALLRSEVTAEGHTMRRLHDVKLVRNTSPVFRLSWTVMHIIDEDSPLYGLDAKTLRDGNMMLFVTVLGLDESYGQTVHARTVYQHDDLRWGCRFIDVISTDDDGVVTLDLEKFHDCRKV